MINPDGVNLIIFDMDGTILPSLPPVYESIKRAFNKLGWPVTFSPEEINRFFGITTASTKGSLYEFITPPDGGLTIPEVREKVREEYKDAFREMARPYPGVKETLTTLRQRGYKLAQYTNATTLYLNTVMDALDIRSYYDYIECIQDNNLTKPELVRKIRDIFGGLTAAVVGDRDHDILAARETGALSVGALYGYGDDEPKQADVTIDKFADLLDIFDRRRPIFTRIIQGVKTKKLKDGATVIGVTGIDGAGKTSFAAGLEGYLKKQGQAVQVIHLDDFLNPRAVRYAGHDQPDNYFSRSFALDRLITNILAPLRKRSSLHLNLPAFDLQTDGYTAAREYSIDKNTVVILEGVFLFRKELAPYLDYKIFLDIPFAESKARAAARDTQEIYEKYDTKYIPAQKKYLEAYPPAATADIIIDNTNWEYPVVKSPR